MAEFQDIYQRYAQEVYRFALYLSGNQALAEDITSETFVRLWASDEKMIRMLTIKLRDAPYAAQIFLIFAVASWIQFFRTRRKLHSSGI